jgi:DNA-binding CsgD family transcriptional regulator
MYGYQTRRGNDAPNASLSDYDKAEIKRRRAEGDTYEEIAQDLGKSYSTVRRFDRGETYGS